MTNQLEHRSMSDIPMYIEFPSNNSTNDITVVPAVDSIVTSCNAGRYSYTISNQDLQSI